MHEKAILLVLIPFTLLCLRDRRHLSAFRPLAVAGLVSLFPLLFTAAEFPVKTAYTLFWLLAVLVAFDAVAPAPERRRFFLLDRLGLLYIVVAVPLVLYCSLLHGLLFRERFEFVPLMFVSAYAALGVVGSWLGFLVVFFAG